METSQQIQARLSVVLPRVSETSELSATVPRETQSQTSGDSSTLSSLSWPLSGVSEKLSRVLGAPEVVASTGEQDSAAPELQAEPEPVPARFLGTQRTLSESLQPFCAFPEVPLRASAPALLLPLQHTAWSHAQMLDLEPIDALNFFCEQQLARLGSSGREDEQAAKRSRRPYSVVRQPQDSRFFPIVRLQEAKVPPLMSLRDPEMVPRAGQKGEEWTRKPHMLSSLEQ